MKVIDTPTLKRLCDRARELQFSHGPKAKFWEDVDTDSRHLIWSWVLHSPNCVRALVLIQIKDGWTVEGLCDLEESAFRAIPDAPSKMEKWLRRRLRVRHSSGGK